MINNEGAYMTSRTALEAAGAILAIAAGVAVPAAAYQENVYKSPFGGTLADRGKHSSIDWTGRPRASLRFLAENAGYYLDMATYRPGEGNAVCLKDIYRLGWLASATSGPQAKVPPKKNIFGSELPHRYSRIQMGMPGANDVPENVDFIELDIPANEQLALVASGFSNKEFHLNQYGHIVPRGCNDGHAFTPEAGANYEFRYDWTEKTCTSTLTKLSPDGRSSTPVATKPVPDPPFFACAQVSHEGPVR